MLARWCSGISRELGVVYIVSSSMSAFSPAFVGTDERLKRTVLAELHLGVIIGVRRSGPDAGKLDARYRPSQGAARRAEAK